MINKVYVILRRNVDNSLSSPLKIKYILFYEWVLLFRMVSCFLCLDILSIIMKRTSRQTTSKSGTPIQAKPKPKRLKYDADQIEKKIRKWRSSSSVAEKKLPTQASAFVTKLWQKVDKSDPEAVQKVLQSRLYLSTAAKSTAGTVLLWKRWQAVG